MVCVPCFIIPLLLFIWHKFFQPILLRYWNPWVKKDEQGNVIKTGPEFPFVCKGGACPYPGAKKNSMKDGTAAAIPLVTMDPNSSPNNEPTIGPLLVKEEAKRDI